MVQCIFDFISLARHRPFHKTPNRAWTAAAVLLFLTAGALLAACGDYTLFPDGSGPGPEPPVSSCERAFPGLAAYDPAEIVVDDTLEYPVAVKVVPEGMEIPLVGGTLKAQEGDLVVANSPPGALSNIYVYLADQSYRSAHALPLLVAGLGDIVPLHEQYTVGSQTLDLDLLFFTALNTLTGAYYLYVYDLQQATEPLMYENPFAPGPDRTPLILPMALGKSTNYAAVFLLENQDTVVRVRFTFGEGGLLPDSVWPIAEGFTALWDLAFYDGNLFVVEKTNSQIYKIANAVTRSLPVQKNQLSPFIGSANLYTPVALALGATDLSTELLVFNEENESAIEQFDPDTGGAPKSTLSVRLVGHLDLAYACQSSMLFFTRSVPAASYGLFRFAPQ